MVMYRKKGKYHHTHNINKISLNNVYIHHPCLYTIILPKLHEKFRKLYPIGVIVAASLVGGRVNRASPCRLKIYARATAAAASTTTTTTAGCRSGGARFFRTSCSFGFLFSFLYGGN